MDIDFLNRMLEAERAGARALVACMGESHKRSIAACESLLR